MADEGTRNDLSGLPCHDASRGPALHDSSCMRTCRMDLQYDGTGLSGWAKQGELPTVEASLERALATVLGYAPGLRVAGRTDAGVHARRQVVSLRLPDDVDLSRLLISLNALTHPGIAVRALTWAPGGFDARRDAVSRGYRYFVWPGRVVSPFWKPYCWRLGGDLDVEVMQAAAAAVAGRHDFTAFTPVETEHDFFERTILRCSWNEQADGGVLRGEKPREELSPDCPLWLEIEADSFLRHMVRTLVGTMIEVGRGKRGLPDFERLLEGARRERAGLTAPAHGLFLWDIRYERQPAE
jgi:tRNA pseudouridine38-40 synthase